MTVSHEIRSIRFYVARPLSRRPLLWLLLASYAGLCLYLQRLGDQTLEQYYALPEEQQELRHPQEYIDMMNASGLPVSPPQRTRANILGLHDIADQYRSVRYCLLLPITGLLVMLLIQHWVLPARLALSYQRVSTPKQASHVYVLPLPGQGRPSLLRLHHQVRRIVDSRIAVPPDSTDVGETPRAPSFKEAIADTVAELPQPKTSVGRRVEQNLEGSSELESTSVVPRHITVPSCTYAESAFFYFLQRKYTCEAPDLPDASFHPNAQSESAPGTPDGQDDTSLPENSGWMRVDHYLSGTGLTAVEHAARLSKFGQNRFIIPVPTVSGLFLDTCMSPYFIFQVFSSAVFFLTNLKFTGIISLLLVLFSEGGSIYSRYTSLMSNRKMVNPASLIRVLRGGEWKLVSSSTLVPGDIVRITQKEVTEAHLHAQEAEKEAAERKAAREAAVWNGADPVASLPTVFQALIKLKRLLFNPQYNPESYSYLAKEGKSFSNLMQCDMAVLDGGLIMDESLLTGESVAQVKSPVFEALEPKDGKILINVERNKTNIAFGGTKIAGIITGPQGPLPGVPGHSLASDTAVETTGNTVAPPPDTDVGADGPAATLVVLRTAFETSQGQLIRKIVFDEERTASVNRDASFFMLVMIVVAALAGVYTFVRGYHNNVAPLNKLILQALNVFIWAIPQSLPMELSMLVAKGVEKLRKRNVYCTEPFTVITAGKVKTCAFDKTGTLCESKVTAVGVMLPSSCLDRYNDGKTIGIDRFDQLLPPHLHDLSCIQYPDINTRAYPEAAYVCVILASCHSVVNINGTLCGDPLEVATLCASEDFGVPPETAGVEPHVRFRDVDIRIIRRFPFNSDLKRMSAIVELSEPPPERRFTKEKIERWIRVCGSRWVPPRTSPTGEYLGDNFWVVSKGAPETMKPLFIPRTIPEKYDEGLKRLTQAGYRVLSLGIKVLDELPTDRQSAEEGLRFAGFLVTDSAVKKDAKAVVEALRASGHRCVVISGDSLNNVLVVAKRCSVISPSEQAFILSDIEETENGPVCVFDLQSDRETKFRLSTSGGAWINSATDIPANVVLCASNDEVFGRLMEHKELSASVLPHITLFGRSTPAQKAELVRALQTQAPVLFVGDGSNDTEGLTAADAGIALLDTPASSEAEKKEGGKSEPGAQNNIPQQPQQAQQVHQPPPLPYPSVMGPNRTLATAQQLMQEARRRASQKGTSYTEEYRARLQEQMVYRRALVARQRRYLVDKINAQTGDGIMALWNESLETEEETSGLPLGDACIAAPFTARNGALGSVLEVLRHGRMSLALTVMNYKTLAIDCLVEAYMESVLMLDGIRFSDYELTIFSLLTAIMGMFIEKTAPAERLSRSPAPPSPFSVAVLGSAAAQTIVHVLGIQAIYRLVDGSGARVTLPFDTKFHPSTLNTCISLFRMFMDLSTNLANYPGSPHMAPIWRQTTLLRILAIYLVLLGVLLFGVVPELNEAIGMAAIGWSLKMGVLAIGVLDVVLSILADKLFLSLFGPRLPKEQGKQDDSVRGRA